jgi:hypothetical protein
MNEEFKIEIINPEKSFLNQERIITMLRMELLNLRIIVYQC